MMIKNLKEIVSEGKNQIACPKCEGLGMFEPCNHPGCHSHITHPCENCGRVNGKCMTCNGTGKLSIHTIILDVLNCLNTARKFLNKSENIKYNRELASTYLSKAFLSLLGLFTPDEDFFQYRLPPYKIKYNVEYTFYYLSKWTINKDKKVLWGIIDFCELHKLDFYKKK